MSVSFSFTGGVHNVNPHIKEKFFLFGLVGNKEMFLHEIVRSGLADRVKVAGEAPSYTTDLLYWKLFVSLQGFGIERKMYSIFLRFADVHEYSTAKELSLIPLSQSIDLPNNVRIESPNIGKILKFRGKLLSRQEAISAWSGTETGRYLQKYNYPVPVVVLDKMCSESDDHIVKPVVRRIAIRRRKS